jgi:hypothetical protein
MSDYDRDREPIRETERTTVVTTGGDRGGGGGVLIAVVLIIAVLGLLFILFGGNFNKAADKVGVNVDVALPKTELKVPDIDVNVPDNINVQLPDVDVKSDPEPKKDKK